MTKPEVERYKVVSSEADGDKGYKVINKYDLILITIKQISLLFLFNKKRA